MRSISSRMISCTRFLTRQPSGSHVHMPAPTCLTMPARTSSLWLSATASPGASRSVGRRYRVARTVTASSAGMCSGRPSATSAASLVASPSVGCAAIESPTRLERGLGLDRDDARLDQLGGLRADGDHAEQLAVARLADHLDEAGAVAVHRRARDRRVRHRPDDDLVAVRSRACASERPTDAISGSV